MCVCVYTCNMRTNVYLREEEYRFVRTRPAGFIRRLVVAAMSGEAPPKERVDEPEPLSSLIENRVIGNIQPKTNPKEPGYCMNGHYCGGMKTCKLCGARVR